MVVLSLDIGAQRTKWGLFERGTLVEEGSFPTPEAPEDLVAMVKKLPRPGRAAAAFAGFLRKKTIAFCPNMPRYQGFPLGHRLEEVTGTEVSVENDGNAFALGEAGFGAGRGFGSVLGITLGTGIGGGLVVDGRVYRGAGVAGEVGHIILDPQGPMCACGRRGCLEAFLGEKAFAGRFGFSSGREAFEARHEEAWDFYGRHLGQGLADLWNALDPEVVVLGGGLSGAYELFERTMMEEIKKGVVAYEAREIRIRTSELGQAAGLWGGYYLVKGSGG